MVLPGIEFFKSKNNFGRFCLLMDFEPAICSACGGSFHPGPCQTFEIPCTRNCLKNYSECCCHLLYHEGPASNEEKLVSFPLRNFHTNVLKNPDFTGSCTIVLRRGDEHPQDIVKLLNNVLGVSTVTEDLLKRLDTIECSAFDKEFQMGSQYMSRHVVRVILNWRLDDDSDTKYWAQGVFEQYDTFGMQISTFGSIGAGQAREVAFHFSPAVMEAANGEGFLCDVHPEANDIACIAKWEGQREIKQFLLNWDRVLTLLSKASTMTLLAE